MMIKQKFVTEGILNANLEKHIKRRLGKANVVKVTVQKTALVSRVIIRAERPGIVIGKAGASINQLAIELKEKFDIENPQIEVEQLNEPAELNAKLMASALANQIERRAGSSWKRSLGFYVKRIMDAGAQGVEINVKGVVLGKGSKSMKYTEKAGLMKKSGYYKYLVRHGVASAVKPAGVVGVQVRILPKSVVIPDKIDLTAHLRKFVVTNEEVEPESKGTVIENVADKTEEVPEVKEEKKTEAKKKKPAAPKVEKKAEPKKAAAPKASEKKEEVKPEAPEKTEEPKVEVAEEAAPVEVVEETKSEEDKKE